MAKKKEPEISVPSVFINADQLSFNHDKEIDNLARFLEERITPSKGLTEVVRSKNILELKLKKAVSKREVKQYMAKYLHKAGLRLDYRILGTHKVAGKEADFIVYPRKVYEV